MTQRHLRSRRDQVKFEIMEQWPGTRCPCGKLGGTQLMHVAYTAAMGDRLEFYDPLNMVMGHGACNTTEETFWKNTNAGLICIARAGGSSQWLLWARGLRLQRGEIAEVPANMQVAIDLYDTGVQPFDIAAIRKACDEVLRGHHA